VLAEIIIGLAIALAIAAIYVKNRDH